MRHRNIAKSRGETQETKPEDRRKALELALRVISHSHQDLEAEEVTALRGAAGLRGGDGTSLRTVAIQVAADAILGDGYFGPQEEDKEPAGEGKKEAVQV